MEIKSFPFKVDSDSTFANDKYYKYKSIYYLVENYTDTRSNDSVVDAFTCNQFDSNYSIYNDYNIVFFRKTSITNADHLRENPKDLDRHSLQKDIILQYLWSNGKFMLRSKFNKGPNPITQSGIVDCDNY